MNNLYEILIKLMQIQQSIACMIAYKKKYNPSFFKAEATFEECERLNNKLLLTINELTSELNKYSFYKATHTI